MSLVASIFGDVSSTPTDEATVSKKKNAKLAALFDTTIATKTSQNEEADSDNDDDSSSSSSSSSSDSDSSSDDDDDDDAGDNEKDNANPQEVKKEDTQGENKEEVKQEEKKPRKPKHTPEMKAAAAAKEASEKDNNKNEKEDEERTVFVGNLPLSTTRKSLAKVFAECGKVLSTRLRSTAVVGVKLPPKRAGDQNLVRKVCTHSKDLLDVDSKSSLQGYVVFQHPDSVPKALALNNKALKDDDPKAKRLTRRMRVDTASPTLDPKRSVFVGNMPYHADEASLADHFVKGCAFQNADIQGVRIIRDKDTFQCKGFGYVLFQDSTMVATALQKMEKSLYLKRPLRVKVCGKSIKGRRGQPTTNSSDKKRSYERGGRQSYGGSNTTPNPNKRQKTSAPLSEKTTKNATTAADISTPSSTKGAMRRVKKKNKRVRGDKKKNLPPGAKPGVSKRASANAKVDKKVKKLERRASKGMGKTRT